MLKTLILAGGKGTRLASVVPDLPKPLAPIAGRPFIQIILSQLASHGIIDVNISIGHMAEQFPKILGDTFGTTKLQFLIEPFPLGTGGAVKFAAQQLCTEKNDELLLVINGDTIFDLSLSDFISTANSIAFDVLIALKKKSEQARFATVNLFADNRIEHFAAKPLAESESSYINAGIYLIRNPLGLLSQYPDTFSLETDFLAKAVKSHFLMGYPATDLFLDIGIPSDYQRAQTLLTDIYKLD